MLFCSQAYLVFFTVVFQIVDQRQRVMRVLGHGDTALSPEPGGELLSQRTQDAFLVVDADDVFAWSDLGRSQSCPSLPPVLVRPARGGGAVTRVGAKGRVTSVSVDATPCVPPP